ncbi:MAG: site-specific DNA-methyltransferase [Bacteroidota bacterium]
MSHERLKPEYLFDEAKIHQLRQLAPECFEDGKINFETLKQNLGAWAQDEEEEGLEHFGLSWPGKKEARRMAAIPPEGTLVPVYGEGLKADGTPDEDGENDSKSIFIEGENLEVLKLLQKSYAGKVKMIYIDPPYNTGNDFIYDDDFTEPLQAYLRRTGQVDEEGKALTTNKRSDGRFHSKWLSMMYPRLKLARNLLREDGVIFISIDENEVQNLRAIMHEIFGEENFISSMVWQSKKGGGNDSNTLVIDHEYVLVYVKDYSQDSFSNILLEAVPLDQKDEKGPYRVGRELNKWGSNSRRIDRPTMWFPIPGPNGEDVYPIRNDGAEGCWRFGKKAMLNIVENNNIKFVKRDDGNFTAYEKIRISKPRPKPYRTWIKEMETTADGSKVVKSLFDEKKVFDFAKPLALLKHLITIGTTKEDDIILDFFSGSASTAHATYEINEAEKKNLTSISVQLQEIVEKDTEAYEEGFRNIAEISKERVRRSLKNSKNLNDKGFHSLSLVSSNYKKWSNYSGASVSELEESLNLFNQEPLRDGWTKEGLLSEIILMEGFVLSSTIEKQARYTANEVKKVSDEYCEHSLLVCLDKDIDPATIKSLDLSDDDVFICLDSAISNVDKLRLSDKGLIKTI